MMRKVLVTRRLPAVVEALTAEFGASVDVVQWDSETEAVPRDFLLANAEGCTGLLCMLTDTIDDAVLKAGGDSLKVVSTMSVGYNHIDTAACSAAGVAVGFTPGVLDATTAETAVALVFAASRHVVSSAGAARSGEWGTWQPWQFCGQDVGGADRTLGIVGLGRIGATFAGFMSGLGMKVVYSGPREKVEEAAAIGAQYRTFDELCAESDVISIHCPLNDATHHLINAEALAKMKPSAVLVNTSRGPVVDQEALADALEAGVGESILSSAVYIVVGAVYV